MRTTLTLDEDLARRLKELARQGGRSFKEVTNEAIRRGLNAGAPQVEGVRPFRVNPKSCGFKPGVDPLKLNQTYDDLEIEKLGRLDTGFHRRPPGRSRP
jgi:hypothetical protein